MIIKIMLRFSRKSIRAASQSTWSIAGECKRIFHKYEKGQSIRKHTVEVRNRFKELDLIDRVPDELWKEVHDIVQETGIKTIPRKRKFKKAKTLSEEAL